MTGAAIDYKERPTTRLSYPVRSQGCMKAPAFIGRTKLALLALVAQMNHTLARFGRADLAAVSFGHLGTIALTVVIVILGAYIAITVIASLLPTFASAVKNISGNFSTADWGNDTANSLGPIFGLIISLLGMFAIVGLVLYAMSFRSGRKD